MKLTIDITRQDYADFNKFHYLKTRLKKTVVTGVLTVVILQLLLNSEEFDLTATIISSIACILVYVFVIYKSINKTKSIPSSDGTILGNKEIDFTEDRIIYKTPNSEGSNSWTTIKKIEESSKAFYLYMDTNLAILIPKRFFNDKSEEEAFRTLVRHKTNTA